MPEQNQESTFDGFVPEKETPQETPPSQEVPEEQATPEETPAQSDSTDGDATTEAKPQEAPADGKTPEQIKEDAAHWQTQYQEARAELDQLRTAPDDESGDEQPDQPARDQKKDQPSAWDLSDEELSQKLRDDPVLLAQVVQEQNRRDMQSIITSELNRIREREKFNNEAQTANRVLANFKAKNQIPDDKFTEARDYVKGLGVNGRPAAIAQMVIDHLNYQMMMGNLQRTTTEVAEKASRAVRQQLLTQQPTDSGQPEAPAAQSPVEHIPARFGRSKSQSVLDEFFG